jgi:hypothetical protein
VQGLRDRLENAPIWLIGMLFLVPSFGFFLPAAVATRNWFAFWFMGFWTTGLYTVAFDQGRKQQRLEFGRVALSPSDRHAVLGALNAGYPTSDTRLDATTWALLRQRRTAARRFAAAAPLMAAFDLGIVVVDWSGRPAILALTTFAIGVAATAFTVLSLGDLAQFRRLESQLRQRRPPHGPIQARPASPVVPPLTGR